MHLLLKSSTTTTTIPRRSTFPTTSTSTSTTRRRVAPLRASKSNEPRTLAQNLSFEDGVFAPAVRIAIALVGLKDLNKLRGKAIALHSQVISSFCKQVGAPPKTKQGLIRLAKKNGHDLGFLVTESAW
ncbi:protein PROTON GRADIENT REGULATION 5 [Chloropicon primus]|nr:protein PROTON GRADIENT REGULATION 5 [Chloropicon primus]